MQQQKGQEGKGRAGIEIEACGLGKARQPRLGEGPPSKWQRVETRRIKKEGKKSEPAE